MNLLHRLARYLETKRVEGEIHRQLARLDDWNLADIGRFARAAARPGVALRADAPRAGTAALVDRAPSLRAA